MVNLPDHQSIYVTIPLMDELENLPLLLKNISAQNCQDYSVYFCVNQPDSWWEDPEKIALCERNLASVEYLEKHCDFPFRVIDRSSKGKGWQGKQLGVGWARKVVMDAVMEDAGPEGIIITLDGDTTFNQGYFSSIQENFKSTPNAVGLSVPYYHKLSGSEAEDRAILRYEIYMRNYVINLWRIKNPYHFTALGSAMAIPLSSYKAIGGMTPKKSGEDFYFLQKLIKYGKLMTWNDEKVYPAARFSDRVFFGTGPAMIKGAAGDWHSYPIYHHSLFDDISRTYEAFDDLFENDLPTAMGDYFRDVLGQNDIWTPLRKNSRTKEQFRKACSDKVDGLRILQFLKHSQKEKGFKNEECLYDFLKLYEADALKELDFLLPGFTFEGLSVEQLDKIRDILVDIEERYQMQHHTT